MTETGRREPTTVPDELAEPWAIMARKQAALNSAKHPGFATNASMPAKRAETAKLAGKVVTGAEAAAKAGALATQHDDDVRGVKAFKRFTGPVGKGLEVIAAEEGFRADLKRGVPVDEAIIKHGGGLGLGLLLGGVGTAGGGIAGGVVGTSVAGPAGMAPGAFAGGLAGGIAGSEAGERIAGAAADGWKDTKQKVRGVTRIVLDTVGRMNNPESWVGRGRLGDTY